jgi:hypothetical protein
MNGFKKHNFKHASASMLNQWIDAPSVFVAQRIFKYRFEDFDPSRKTQRTDDDQLVMETA